MGRTTPDRSTLHGHRRGGCCGPATHTEATPESIGRFTSDSMNSTATTRTGGDRAERPLLGLFDDSEAVPIASAPMRMG